MGVAREKIGQVFINIKTPAVYIEVRAALKNLDFYAHIVCATVKHPYSSNDESVSKSYFVRGACCGGEPLGVTVQENQR